MSVSLVKKYGAHLFLIVAGALSAIALIEFSLGIASYIAVTGRHARIQQSSRTEGIKILCIGESTTQSAPSTISWPTQLENELKQKYPELKITVINGGVSGYSSSRIAENISSWLQEVKPNIVISMVGINDNWNAILLNQATPITPPPPPVSQTANSWRVIKLISYLLKFSAANNTLGVNSELSQPTQISLFEKRVEAHPDDLSAWIELKHYYRDAPHRLKRVLGEIANLTRKPEDYRQFSDFLVKDNDPEAYSLIESFHKNFPDDWFIATQLGLVSHRTNPKLAEELYRRAIHLEPRASRPRLLLANLFEINNRERDANQIYDSALQGGFDSDIGMEYASSLKRRGQIDENKQFLTNFLEKSPASEWAIGEQAALCASDPDDLCEHQVTERALRSRIRYSELIDKKSIFLIRRNKIAEAVENAKRAPEKIFALRSDCKECTLNELALSQLDLLERQIGNSMRVREFAEKNKGLNDIPFGSSEASKDSNFSLYDRLQFLQRALGLSSEHTDLLLEIMDLYLALGDERKALQAASDLLAIKSSDRALDIFIRLSSDPKAGEIVARRFLAESPNDPVALTFLADVIHRRNRAEAERLYRMALDGGYYLTFKNYAARLFTWNRISDGIAVLNKARSIGYRNSAIPELATLLNQHKHFDSAKALLENDCQTPGVSSESFVILSDLYQQHGNRSEAVATMESALALFPDQPHLAYSAVRVLLANGEYCRALDVFAQYASFLNPTVAQCENCSAYQVAYSALLREVDGDATLFSKCNEVPNKATIAEFSYLPVTLENYQRINDAIRNFGAQQIAMQYPLVSIRTLQAGLGRSKGLVFVENRENFENALKAHTFEELFTDRFASIFGHLTTYGNSLIAHQVAPVVEQMLVVNQNTQFANHPSSFRTASAP